MNLTEPFKNQQYLNLETYRRNGIAVKTPVWFVQDGEILYVRTLANSGKVKRIRNNSEVQIAPCKVDGALLGSWIPAQAREMNDHSIDRKVDQLLGKKYRLMKTMFSLASALKGQKYTVLEIKEKLS